MAFERLIAAIAELDAALVELKRAIPPHRRTAGNLEIMTRLDARLDKYERILETLDGC